MMGTAAIITANLTMNFEAEIRWGFRALVLALIACGALVYLRDDVFTSLGIEPRAFSFSCLVGKKPIMSKASLRWALWRRRAAATLECPAPAYQADDQVPQARQHLRGGPSAHLRAVLVEGDIPYPVEAVLDAPMPTGKAQQSPRIGISGWETANCIAHIHLFLALHDPLAL